MAKEPQERETWTGHWFVELRQETGTELGTAHIKLYRFMQDHEKGALFAELRRAYPDDPYEASCVEDTFNSEEVEIIKTYFADDPQIEVRVEPATKPAPGWAGMAAFGDMYCGIVEYPELDELITPATRGTISHYATPDNDRLAWDESLATVSFSATGDVLARETDRERALKEMARRREQRYRRLQDMANGDE